MPIQVAKVREFKGHTQAIYTLCKGVEPESFYSAGADGMVVLWNNGINDGELLAKLDHPVYCLLMYEDLLFCGGNNGVITIINVNTRQMLKILRIHPCAVFDMKFYENRFIVAHDNGVLSILDLKYDLIEEIKLSAKSLRKILIANDEIYISGSEGMIWRMNGEYKITGEIKADNLSIFALGFQNKKNILLSGGRDAVLKLWDDLGYAPTVVNAHWYHIKDIAFNESQQYLATCSMDKSIKIWDGDNFELLKVIDYEKFGAHQSSVNKILWIEQNRFISCSDDRMIMCFEILR